MGNLCSSSSDRDPFAEPGRTLDSTPPQARTSKPPRVGGPPRTLGGAANAAGPGAGNGPGYGTNAAPQTEGQRGEARRAAAMAAEARAKSNSKPVGKLGADLQKQKAQTRRETLEQASWEERRGRDADAGAEVRAYD